MLGVSGGNGSVSGVADLCFLRKMVNTSKMVVEIPKLG